MKHIMVLFVINLFCIGNLSADYRDFLISDLKNKNNKSEVIVISEKSNFSTLEKYLNYRKIDFPSISLIDIQDIYLQFPNDKASSVRDFLFYVKNFWMESKVKNVLLVGWFDKIPNLRLREDGLNKDTAGKDTYLVLDTLNNVDTLVFNIGRYPIRNTKDLEIMINKTISFEQNSINSKFDAAMFIDSVDGKQFENYGENIYNKFVAERAFKVSGDPKSQYYHSFEQWLNLINQGTTYLFGFFHGNSCTWGLNKFLTCDMYLNTQFNNNPFLFLAVSCSQGNRDTNKAGILELLLTKDEFGAVASIASENQAWLSRGSEIISNFINKKFSDNNLRLGELWRYSINNSLKDNFRFNYTLLGDPLLKLNPITSDYAFDDDKQEHSIYPNPATDFITISFVSCRPPSRWPPTKIEIFDIVGVKVISEPIHPMTLSHRMNIEKLPAGVYFVKFGDRVEKFVKM